MRQQANISWQPTMHLRWYYWHTTEGKKLQQKWISNTGKFEWRDIELVFD